MRSGGHPIQAAGISAWAARIFFSVGLGARFGLRFATRGVIGPLLFAVSRKMLTTSEPLRFAACRHLCGKVSDAYSPDNDDGNSKNRKNRQTGCGPRRASRTRHSLFQPRLVGR